MLEVVGHGLEAGHIASVEIGQHLQGAQTGKQNAPAEVVDVMGGAVVHHVQQQLFGDDVGLQRLQGVGRVSGIDGQIAHQSIGTLGDVDCVAGGALQLLGAEDGDVSTAVQMLLEHFGHGQVDHHVAPAHDDILLTDVLEIGVDARQRLHVAAVFPAAAPLCHAEGGQDAQAAVLAAQVPVLAGTHMVQQGLIALVDD